MLIELLIALLILGLVLYAVQLLPIDAGITRIIQIVLVIIFIIYLLRGSTLGL